MTKFIIFTDNNKACFPESNPFDLLLEGNSFGNTGRTVGVISSKENWFLPNPSEFIDEFKGYDILLLADKVFDETQNYVSYIKAFVRGEQDIHVLIHKGGGEQRDAERKKYQLELIKLSLGEDFENVMEQNHSSSSIYWNEFLEIAKVVSKKLKDEDFYKSLLLKLKTKFPDPYLSSFIHLHKSLVLIPLNINEKDLNKTFLNEELKRIKKHKNDKVRLAFNKYKAEDFTPTNLNDRISAIENEIIQLSVTR